MTQLYYLLCISRATSAKELHGLRQDAERDQALTRQEAAEIASAVGKRFGALNYQAAGPQVPRWSPTPRIPIATRVH